MQGTYRYLDLQVKEKRNLLQSLIVTGKTGVEWITVSVALTVSIVR